ncbi:hypothetical protein KY319_01900 [Candidatus Woesearchaeota archaeon]|nr:hypothetical protein [Candidatus Woesearchaeota archaeon]
MKSKKASALYSVILLFIVIVALPVLYWRMTSEVETTKETIGETQVILLRAPYAKEDTINYVEKAAELELPKILKEIEAEVTAQNCNKNTADTINEVFNKHLNVYIDDFNKKSYTKIPKNNYDIYIEGNNIHAIATIPVEKTLARPGTQLTTIGKMWFSPSFTITTTSPEFQKMTTAIEAKKQACATI